MKSDVMNDFDTIKVATAYEIGGRTTSEFPYEIDGELKPVYTEFEGWKCDLRKYGRYEEFPEAFKRYVEFIERQTGVPVKIISVGPDRNHCPSGVRRRFSGQQQVVSLSFGSAAFVCIPVDSPFAITAVTGKGYQYITT